MDVRKIYYTSAGIIALVFLTKIIIEIWNDILFSSILDVAILPFLIITFLIEKDKINKRKQNNFLISASYLVIIWFIINIFITFSSILILNEFAQENALYQTTNLRAIFMMILAGTSNFAGFLFIPIIVDLIGLHIYKHHRNEVRSGKNLKPWLNGGIVGVIALIALMVIPSLFDTSCNESNFLQSWGGEGCNSLSQYISVHLSNFISTFFFMITTGLPLTIGLIIIFFGIGAGIGHWIDDKK